MIKLMTKDHRLHSLWKLILCKSWQGQGTEKVMQTYRMILVFVEVKGNSLLWIPIFPVAQYTHSIKIPS